MKFKHEIEIECDPDGVHCGECDWYVWNANLGWWYCVLFVIEMDINKDEKGDKGGLGIRHDACLDAERKAKSKASTDQGMIMQLCKQGIQNCHFCMNYDCGDNTNPERENHVD